MDDQPHDRLLECPRDIPRDHLRYHTRRVAVTKEFTFDAAHHLYEYAGVCKNLHGHTYRLSVTVSGHLDEHGFVIDFKDLKRVVKEAVVDNLDHRYLNAVLPPMNTTAENIVVWIFERIQTALAARNDPRGLRVERLVLWETPSSSAEVTREWMEDR